MPNQDFPRGFIPIKTLSGAPISVNPYIKDASANALFKYDVVMMEADGHIARAGSDASGSIVGIILHQSATATAATVLVADNPDLMFIVQGDGSLAETSIGNNASLERTAGNGTSKQSAMEIDSSSAATTSLPVKILGLHRIPGNAWGSWAVVEGMFNKHFNAHGTGHAGI